MVSFEQLKIKSLRISAIILICALLFCFTLPVMAEGTQAELLNSSIKATINDTAASKNLFDNKLSTKYTFQTDQIVHIESETPIKSLYILFQNPNKWTLWYDNQSTSCGIYGFLHEFVELTYEQTSIELSFPKDTVICDIRVYSKGEVPSDVEKWQPPYDDADMLLLPTHADDEHLFFGGIMPYYAGQLNKKVQVAYLTNHSGEWYRQHELLEGLWHVGIKAYPIIPEFKDYYSESLEHAKTLYNTDEMLAYQVGLLRRFRPEVVIGHDLNGEYGHGVHMLNASLLTQAILLSNDSTYMPESIAQYDTFDVPKTYLHLYEKNQIVMDIDIPLSNFGNKTAYQMAQEGFAKHVSQTKYFTVEKKGPYDCRKFGLYRSTVGLDTIGNDFFENIKVEEEKPITETSSQEETVSSQPESASSSVSKPAKEKSGDGSIYVLLGMIVIIFTLQFSSRRKKRKN